MKEKKKKVFWKQLIEEQLVEKETEVEMEVNMKDKNNRLDDDVPRHLSKDRAKEDF